MIIGLIVKEFVKMYAKLFGGLSPDAYSAFSKGTETTTKDNDDIEKATNYLIEHQVPKCIEDLENFVSIDPFVFIEQFHRNGTNLYHLFLTLQGVNLRHLGNARAILNAKIKEKKSPVHIKWAKTILIEMLARTIKNQLGKFEKFG